MHLYRMGPDAGPHRIGIHRDAPGLFERQRENLPAGSSLSTVDLGTGEAMMALTHMRQRKAMRGDWLFLRLVDADAVMNEAAMLVQKALNRIDDYVGLDRNLFGRVMHHIRTVVFGTTQEMIGQMTGKSESLVSRWESGDQVPSLDEFMRLRAVAVDLGLAWDDRLLLAPATYLEVSTDRETC